MKNLVPKIARNFSKFAKPVQKNLTSTQLNELIHSVTESPLDCYKSSEIKCKIKDQKNKGYERDFLIQSL